jgi:hypothetical protein
MTLPFADSIVKVFACYYGSSYYYVSSHYYMCPHTTMCVLIVLYMCRHTTMCRHTSMCVLILRCVLKLLYLASSFYYVSVLCLYLYVCTNKASILRASIVNGTGMMMSGAASATACVC